MASQRSCMEIRTAGRCLAALSLVGILLTAGCTSPLPSGDVQARVDTHPHFPFKIMAPIHYLGAAVNESDAMITTLIFNLTVVPESSYYTIPEQDREVNITEMYITYSDGREIYTLEPGEFSISRRESEGEAELMLPLQEPVPANTSVFADFWMPEQGTLVLSFRTPEAITEPSGQITEFTTE